MNALSTVATSPKFNIFENIEGFLMKAKNRTRSIQTLNSYKSNIKNFFVWKVESVNSYEDMIHLTEYDLALKLNDIDLYQDYLINELNNNNKTVNHKVGTIKSLYSYLRKTDITSEQDMKSFINVNNLPTQKNKYGVVKPEELDMFVEYILNKKVRGRQCNLTKANLMKFSAQTGLRLSSCLKLSPADFVKVDDGYEVYAEEMKGGKNSKKMLSEKFYEELMEMYELECNGEGLLFQISKSTINDMMKDLRIQFNISEKRNITFHSLRKLGAEFAYESSGKDITVVRDFLDHSNVAITEDYLEDNDVIDLGIITAKERFDNDLYKAATHEELLKVIEGSDVATKLMINKKLLELN